MITGGRAARRTRSCKPDWRRQTTRNPRDRKSTRLNSSHDQISYAVFCLKKKKKNQTHASHSLCEHPPPRWHNPPPPEPSSAKTQPPSHPTSRPDTLRRTDPSDLRPPVIH